MIPLDYDLIETAVPWWMVISCRNRWHLRNFVETGTSLGLTALTAARHFRWVHTVEISPAVYGAPVPELLATHNVTRHLGNSPEIIPRILCSLDGPTLWYLDAHWCGNGPVQEPVCPLLDEIAALGARDTSGDVVMIDNYGVLEHCRPPQDQANWPSVERVIEQLNRCLPDLWITVVLDVLMARPAPRCPDLESSLLRRGVLQ